MDPSFTIIEPRTEPVRRTDLMVGLLRSRWELEKRCAELEVELREQVATLREMREKLAAADYQQREMLKAIARVADDCDDTLHIESARVTSAHLTEAGSRQSARWRRRVERTRDKLTECLNAFGATVRTPSGAPDEKIDTIHSRVETLEAPPGEVIKVLRTGLVWKGALLRHSLVVVAEAPSEPPAPVEGAAR